MRTGYFIGLTILFVLLAFILGYWLGRTQTPVQPVSSPATSGLPETVITHWPALEIHSKHFIYGMPVGTPLSNDLIIRDIYALSSNDSTKFADWVAYRLDRETVEGEGRQVRRWQPDPWLDPEETLEPEDYRRANQMLQVDRGHQAPLASFKGTSEWQATNYLSNITPQRAALNQGPWRELEDRVRRLVQRVEPVYVITGPLYEREMPTLPSADEPHRIPSGYWKVIVIPQQPLPDSLKVIAFILDQEVPRRASLKDFVVSVNEVEARTGLDLLHELPDTIEERIESTIDTSLINRFFVN